MRKYNFPLTSLLLAFILGPKFEMSFRQALSVSRGSFIPFFTKPLSLLFIVLTVITSYIVLKKLKAVKK